MFKLCTFFCRCFRYFLCTCCFILASQNEPTCDKNRSFFRCFLSMFFWCIFGAILVPKCSKIESFNLALLGHFGALAPQGRLRGPQGSKRPTGGQKYNPSAPDSPNDQRTRKKAQHQPTPTNSRPTPNNSAATPSNSRPTPDQLRSIPINSYPLRCLAFCPKLREGGIFQRR